MVSIKPEIRVPAIDSNGFFIPLFFDYIDICKEVILAEYLHFYKILKLNQGLKVLRSTIFASFKKRFFTFCIIGVR